MEITKKQEFFRQRYFRESQKLVNHIASLSPEMLWEEGEKIIEKANEIRSKFWEIERGIY